MARSRKQIANSAKIVAVAALAKEFRKSAIIDKMLQIIRKRNMIAKGDLVSPKKSRSLTPYADDRWLTGPNAVKVNVGPIVAGVPEYVIIETNIPNSAKEVVAGRYFYLTSESPNKKWFPPVNAMAAWVRRKMARGAKFEIDGRPASQVHAKRLGFLIARKISQKGIRKTNFANPLKYKNTGVDATIQRGVNKAAERIVELYGETVVDAIGENINNIFTSNG